MDVVTEQFRLPLWWDVLATMLFALAGTVKAIRRGYDIVGILVVALVASLGGGMLRDLLIGTTPPASLQDGRFLMAVVGGATLGILLQRSVPRLQPFIEVVNAVSIGLYSVFGMQKALVHGVPDVGALVIGFLNAVGGGLLRDIMIREEPEIFRPGHFYAVAVFLGLATFLVIGRYVDVTAERAAIIAIAVTVLLRGLALRFNWRTRRFG